MRIAVFAYDFPTLKIEQGLHRLVHSGFKPVIVLAAPRIELSFYQSKVRVAPRDVHVVHPANLARGYGIPYFAVPHASPECLRLLQEAGVDVGVILGARILPLSTIGACGHGIVNLHPAPLPDMRGLDTIKWAVLLNKPIGATAHYIDHRIDRGWLLTSREAAIYRDDTLLDLWLRVTSIERDLMVEALSKIQQVPEPEHYPALGAGTYYKAVPLDLEAELPAALEAYVDVRGTA